MSRQGSLAVIFQSASVYTEKYFVQKKRCIFKQSQSNPIKFPQLIFDTESANCPRQNTCDYIVNWWGLPRRVKTCHFWITKSWWAGTRYVTIFFFWNLIKSNHIWIVMILFRLIWNQPEIRLVPNQPLKMVITIQSFGLVWRDWGKKFLCSLARVIQREFLASSSWR